MSPSKRIFITGIPTAGKSYLGKKLSIEVEGIHVAVDDLRKELGKDERYRKWVDLYLDKDEYTFYTTSNNDQLWNTLVQQSEALWLGILEYIESYEKEPKSVIFEGVNLLPHLAHKDMPFPGVVLIGKSYDEVLERNKQEPRWGETEELQKLEANAFFYVERPRYKEEAIKYHYPVFETVDEAYATALGMLR